MCKTQQPTSLLGFSFWGMWNQAQDVDQRLPVIFGGAGVAVFPLPHCPGGNPSLLSHFPLVQIGFNALQMEMIAQCFRIDGNELSRAKSASRMVVNDPDCPLCNSQQRAQPPLVRSVPLSRFTSRVGGGSAFFVRQQESRRYFRVSLRGDGFGDSI